MVDSDQQQICELSGVRDATPGSVIETEDGPLTVGAFYWVLPVLDVDTNDEWVNADQPARFAGILMDNTLMWHMLGVEGVSYWSMRWVGMEIKR